MHKINRYEDSGSLCLMSLEGSKDSKAPPLTKMEMLEEVTQLMITLVSFGGKLKS